MKKAVRLVDESVREPVKKLFTNKRLKPKEIMALFDEYGIQFERYSHAFVWNGSYREWANVEAFECFREAAKFIIKTIEFDRQWLTQEMIDAHRKESGLEVLA